MIVVRYRIGLSLRKVAMSTAMIVVRPSSAMLGVSITISPTVSLLTCFLNTLLGSLEPLQWTRSEVQVTFGFLIRRTSKPGRVIDGIGAGRDKRLLLRGLRRFRSSARASKCGQPYALLARVIVHNIVRSRRASERRHGRRGGIFYVDETPHALALADDRDMPLANLLAHIASVRIPGARPVKESVTHRDAVYCRCPKGCQFQLNIRTRAGGDAG